LFNIHSSHIEHVREQGLTHVSNCAIVIPYSVATDAQVVDDEVTTTQPLQSVTVKGAAVDPAGGATRYPAAMGTARKAATRRKISILMDQ
jgi:hypothetical protein